MADPLVLTTTEVAERLHISPAAFHKRKRSLIEQHGFPPPVPGLGHRYDPEAIAAWLARQRQLASPTPPANDTAPAEIDWSAEMARRAAAIAAGRR